MGMMARVIVMVRMILPLCVSVKYFVGHIHTLVAIVYIHNIACYGYLGEIIQAYRTMMSQLLSTVQVFKIHFV